MNKIDWITLKTTRLSQQPRLIIFSKKKRCIIPTGTLSGILATMRKYQKQGNKNQTFIFPQILVISQGQKTQCSTFLIPFSSSETTKMDSNNRSWRRNIRTALLHKSTKMHQFFPICIFQIIYLSLLFLLLMLFSSSSFNQHQRVHTIFPRAEVMWSTESRVF